MSNYNINISGGYEGFLQSIINGSYEDGYVGGKNGYDGTANTADETLYTPKPFNEIAELEHVFVNTLTVNTPTDNTLTVKTLTGGMKKINIFKNLKNFISISIV